MRKLNTMTLAEEFDEDAVRSKIVADSSQFGYVSGIQLIIGIICKLLFIENEFIFYSRQQTPPVDYSFVH